LAAQIEALRMPSEYELVFSFGTSLSRKYFSFKNKIFPLPFIAINGELDGLHRLSRVAESMFKSFQSPSAINRYSVLNRPISVVIKGLNHLQFANKATHPPYLVLRLDLRGETLAAHKDISVVLWSFLCLHHKANCDKHLNNANIVHYVKQTYDLLSPFISAYILEASPRLFKHCNSDHPSPHCPYYAAWPPQEYRSPSNDTECVCGVPFAQVALQTLSGLSKNYPLTSVDAVHDFADRNPFHHPHVWTNCSETNKKLCKMNATTVSTPMYEEDNFDSGFYSNSAYEIRIK